MYVPALCLYMTMILSRMLWKDLILQTQKLEGSIYLVLSKAKFNKNLHLEFEIKKTFPIRIKMDI